MKQEPANHVIAVSSGKGGVGKTQIVANLAVAFARRGLRVLALDGDLGLSNLDMILGAKPQSTLLDLLDGGARIEDIITECEDGLDLLAGCSGRYDLANLGAQERHGLFSAVDSLESFYDVLLVDTGAGIGSNAVAFAAAAQTVLVVATPEPTSLADAYGLIKVVHSQSGIKRFSLVANMVTNEAEGESIYQRLATLANRFLGVGIDYVGAVPRDRTVRKAVHAGQPVTRLDPNAPASRCMTAIARRLAETEHHRGERGGIQLFWKRLVGWRMVS